MIKKDFGYTFYRFLKYLEFSRREVNFNLNIKIFFSYNQNITNHFFQEKIINLIKIDFKSDSFIHVR